MTRPFHRANPLQAGKLAGTLLVTLTGVGIYVGVLPSSNVIGLFLLPLYAMALVGTVLLETAHGVYLAVRRVDAVIEQGRTQPGYTLVRAIEAGAALGAVAGFMALLAAIPPGPMAGPGAMGVLFVVIGLGLVVVAGTLVRTLVELYRHRRGCGGEVNAGDPTPAERR